ncbi:hypothetical protein QM361_01290 [Streptococcus intermedius]
MKSLLKKVIVTVFLGIVILGLGATLSSQLRSTRQSIELIEIDPGPANFF